MSNFPALEVVIGLSFIFFVFSLVASSVTEWVATKLNWRSRMLEVGIENIFSGSDSITDEGVEHAQEFWQHPLIQALARPKSEQPPKPQNGAAAAAPAPRSQPRPSYVPSRTFVLALLDLGARAHATKQHGDAVTEAQIAKVKLLDAIGAIHNKTMQQALMTLYREAEGDARRFRRNAEQWFDDSMERVSGWYKRHAQRALIIAGLVIVLALNVDTIQIATTLWRDDAARAVLVKQAEQASQRGSPGTNGEKAASKLPVPIGWTASFGQAPGEFPDTFGSVLSKLLGLAITVVALTFGAPFWFDLLSKFVRVRGTGAPPPASNAVRKGEGEETRYGDYTLAGAGGSATRPTPPPGG
jgi:hypothetical protein